MWGGDTAGTVSTWNGDTRGGGGWGDKCGMVTHIGMGALGVEVTHVGLGTGGWWLHMWDSDACGDGCMEWRLTHMGC